MTLKRDVERGCLTTLDGQPITGRRALLFDFIEAHCLTVAQAHVAMQKHGVSVRKVPFNANAQLLDEGIEWDQAYALSSSVIHGYTKAFRGDQLAVLNRTWSTIARRQDGSTALAPSLPEDLQDAFGEQTLLHFTLSQLRGLKSNKTALSKDQQVASECPSCHSKDRARPRASGVGKREGHMHRRRHPEVPGSTATVCMYA